MNPITRTCTNTWRTLLWLTLFSLALLGLSVPSVAAVSVAGPITTSTTWSLANQPYTVTADVIVDSGATLTIEPGVTVLMNAATNLIVRNGALNAQGTVTNRIIITSARDIVSPPNAPAPGDWGNLKFELGTLSATTTLADMDVRFGKGIIVESASPLLNRLNITQHLGPAIAINLESSPIGTGLTATGNSLNGIRVGAGDIVGSITWGLVGIPYVVETGIVGVGRAAISLSPVSSTVVPGVVIQFTVALGTVAPAGGLVVDLVSSAPTVATVPATLTIPAGSSSATFSLTATGLGLTTITASKLGLGDATATVRVNAPPTVTLSPTAVTLGLNKIRTITATLSAPAPTGGVVLNLTSSAPTFATVPATATVVAGASSTTFDVTTLAAGTTTITAASTGYASGTSTVIVRPVALALPVSTVVAPGSSVSVPITLTEPAPVGGLTVSLITVNPAVATVAATVAVAAGASAANVNVTGVVAGNTTLTATAPGYDSGTGAIVVDTIALDFSPNAAQTIAQGLTRELRATITKPAPAGGLTVNVSIADTTKATVSPSTVVIAAGQTSSVTPFVVTGVASGATTISVNVDGVTPKSISLTITNPPSLALISGGGPLGKVGKSLRTGTGYYRLQRLIGTTPYDSPEALVVSLSSSDPSRLTVPATVTIPASQSTVFFSMTGVDITTTAVQVDASAAGYLAPTKLAMQVVAPEIQFFSLDNSRSTASARDDFYMSWLVTGAWDAGQQVSAVDTSLALSVVESNPVGIVGGFFNAATAGTSITSATIVANQNASYIGSAGNNTGFQFVGVPTQSGSYKVSATAANIGTWNSAVQNVIAPSLNFVSGGSTQNKVGKGLRTASGFYRLQRTINGSAFNGVDALIVTLTSSDPAKLTVPMTVTIPANQSTAFFQITGVDITTTAVQIDASASGYTSPVSKLAMQVVTPEIVFQSLDNSRSTSSARDDFYMYWSVPGAWDASSQVSASDVPLALSTSESVPTGIVDGFYSAATAGALISSVTIFANQNGSHANASGSFTGYQYVGVPTQSGSYRVTATAANIGSWSSVVQNVISPTFTFGFSGSLAASKVGKGLSTASNYYSVRRTLNGTGFNGTDAVTVTLTSSDPTKLTVPATVTIPAGQPSVTFVMTGVDITSTAVQVTASASGYTTSATPLAMQVVTPEIQFMSLDNSRSTVGTRDNFYMQWNVVGAWDSTQQTSTTDISLALTITEASPAGIVDGVYAAATAGSLIANAVILAGRTTSLGVTNNVYQYVGVPTAQGSYKVTATATGIGSWSSVVQNVVGAQLTIINGGFTSIRVGKGMMTAVGYNRVQRTVNGTAFVGPDPVTVTFTCAAATVCSAPTATIPGGQSEVTVFITGNDVGSTVLNASATGYITSVGTPIQVIIPSLVLSIPTSVRAGATAGFSAYFNVPGAWDSSSQTALTTRTISFTSATPSAATVPATGTVAAGATVTPILTLTGVSAGTTTTVTASAVDANSVTSPTITVTP